MKVTFRLRARFWAIVLRAVGDLLLLAGLAAAGFGVASYLQLEIYQWRENEKFAKTLETRPGFESRGAPRLGSSALQRGAPFGRLEIPRIGVSAIVVEGVENRDLKLAIGHIPGTALPGESGNVALAGHRDTLFRRLGQIRESDVITLTTLSGIYRYAVESRDIVAPNRMEVLDDTSEPVLTLVTCYPFYYLRASAGKVHCPGAPGHS